MRRAAHTPWLANAYGRSAKRKVLPLPTQACRCHLGIRAPVTFRFTAFNNCYRSRWPRLDITPRRLLVGRWDNCDALDNGKKRHGMRGTSSIVTEQMTGS